MIHWTHTGNSQGVPVLFLHAGTYSGTMWSEITDRLGDVRCILPDLPGHGYSRDIELCSLEQAADEVAALIEGEFGGGPVNLVGLSFGGYVGLKLMIGHPHLIGRAMISGIHLGEIPNARSMNLFAGLISPLMRLRSFRRKMAAPLRISDPSIIDRSDGAANFTPRTLRRLLRLVSVFDVYDLLPRIRIPTLMIAGAKEHSMITGSLDDFACLMHDCTACTVPEMGHAWCNEDPDLFAQTVQAWINHQPLPTRLTPIEV